jgi:hypothetical protein
MNDETRPFPSDPFDAVDAPTADPFGRPGPAATPEGTPAPAAPAASFSGRALRKADATRAGVIVGTGLVLTLGAAVAMGASPSSSPTTAGQAQTGAGAAGSAAPGASTAPGEGGKGFGHGPFGGPNRGPGRGDGPGFGRADGRGFGQISVAAVSGSSLSLATADGWTRTITVTDATKVTKGGAAATLADIAVGDSIRFGQTRNADGTFTITAIDIVQPQVAGSVTAVTADSITITLRDGTSQTVKTTGSTTYHLERADGARSDVTVGSDIVATGEKAADGSLTASSVWVRLPHVGGTVTSTTATTITLTERDGTTVTVHVGSGTAFRVAGVEAATIADVKAGMRIVVEGAKRADGSIDATAIGAGDLGGKGFGRGHDGPKDGSPDASPAPDASAGTDG